jgi:hypothetical protein
MYELPHQTHQTRPPVIKRGGNPDRMAEMIHRVGLVLMMLCIGIILMSIGIRVALWLGDTTNQVLGVRRILCVEGYLYAYIGKDDAPIPLFRDGRPRSCPDLGEYEISGASELVSL